MHYGLCTDYYLTELVYRMLWSLFQQSIFISSMQNNIMAKQYYVNMSLVDMVLNDKLAAFRLLASRLTSLQAQDALFLLKNCFSTPKLLYMLRCAACIAACYKSAVLSEYDGVIRDTLKIVLNVDLADDIWKQATLPVSKGGLGVRLASDLALPAFLSWFVSQWSIRADFAVASSSFTRNVFNSWSGLHPGESWMATT